jgi:hypothetical protein
MTDRHAAVDYAQMLKKLSDTHFPRSRRIVLVQGNPSTPSQPRSTKPFRLRKPVAWLSGSSGTTRLSMAWQLTGLGWLRTQCAVVSVPRSASPTRRT